MKTALKNKIAAIAFAVAVLGAGAIGARADRDDYRGYHDWDHHNGWHRHFDDRVYYTGPSGYYEPGVVYGSAYPAYSPPPAAYYAPYEPGLSVNIPIR